MTNWTREKIEKGNAELVTAINETCAQRFKNTTDPQSYENAVNGMYFIVYAFDQELVKQTKSFFRVSRALAGSPTLAEQARQILTQDPPELPSEQRSLGSLVEKIRGAFIAEGLGQEASDQFA